MTALVVGGNGDVDELGWGVGIAERNDGDVDVRGFLDGLRVGTRVRDDNEPGLFERAGDIVGKVSRSKAAGNSNRTGVRGELEDGALAVRTSRDDTDIGRVVDSGDNPGCEDNLLPEEVLASVDGRMIEKGHPRWCPFGAEGVVLKNNHRGKHTRFWKC